MEQLKKEGEKQNTTKLHYRTTALKDLTESGTQNPARQWNKLSGTEILTVLWPFFLLKLNHNVTEIDK